MLMLTLNQWSIIFSIIILAILIVCIQITLKFDRTLDNLSSSMNSENSNYKNMLSVSYFLYPILFVLSMILIFSLFLTSINIFSDTSSKSSCVAILDTGVELDNY